MMTYQQSTGILEAADGSEMGVGYSGNGLFMNQTGAENVPMHGPVPRGKYTLVPLDYSIPSEAYLVHLGPLAFRLNPDQNNEMFGRSGFFIHGDNVEMDHTASDGCIILAHDIRQAILNAGDFVLQVVA